jgi:hypothetical protein
VDANANERSGGGAVFREATKTRVLPARGCGGRIVSMLEGGYELGALGRSTATHVWTLMKA